MVGLTPVYYWSLRRGERKSFEIKKILHTPAGFVKAFVFSILPPRAIRFIFFCIPEIKNASFRHLINDKRSARGNPHFRWEPERRRWLQLHATTANRCSCGFHLASRNPPGSIADSTFFSAA